MSELWAVIVARTTVPAVAGRPLLFATVMQAMRSGRLDRVVVVTEDEATAERAEREGAEVVRGSGADAVAPRLEGTALAACLSFYSPLDAPADDRVVELLSSQSHVTPPPAGLRDVDLVAFDFDGVMTDDTVVVREDGMESVIANRGDGMGILRLKRAGVRVVVISKEINKVVAARCRKLDILCHHGIDDKLTLLRDLSEKQGVPAERLAFVGNDVNDMECMEWAAFGIAVANSRPEVLALADWITAAEGGHGAVREVCEAIIRAKS